MSSNTELMKKAYKRIEEMQELVNSDYYRLKYHIVPSAGLLNDPNGFIHINGQYHLFYQLNPFDTKHGAKFWAHVKSSDLVNWEQLPLALAPDEWYEYQGCYSGSAVNNNGIFTLIYTGNVKDQSGNRDTYQCLAFSKDGINFEKYKNNPVMYNQPMGYTRNFRDPKVWKKDGNWYMVIGGQRESKDGAALMFKSQDLKNWSFMGEAAGSKAAGLNEFGYMWECPNIFDLGDKDVLLVCPQGLEAKGDLYNNIYQTGYFLGKLNYESGKLEHGDFIELDRGFEFYAPQVTVDEKGRRVIFAWMGLPDEDEHPTVEKGWIHAMTMPRVMELIDNKIYQKPVEEFKNLRKNSVQYNDIIIEDNEIDLQDISGDIIELLAEFELQDALEFGIRLRFSDDLQEETVISYDAEESKLVFDRNKSGKGYGGIRRCKLEKAKETRKIKLNIFIDTSSVEIFVNDGEETFTARIYPDKNSKGIKFFAKGGSVKLKNLTKWDL